MKKRIKIIAAALCILILTLTACIGTGKKAADQSAPQRQETGVSAGAASGTTSSAASGSDAARASGARSSSGAGIVAKSNNTVSSEDNGTTIDELDKELDALFSNINQLDDVNDSDLTAD